MFQFRRKSTWRLHKSHVRTGHYSDVCKLCRLTQYGNRCDWLKDDKFLRDLEGDSVDTEILDEELRSLQEDEPQTCRGKSVKFLESNPLQIVLCVLVLIDAGVVVAEILLDLHAIRGQYREAKHQLHQVLDFIKETHVDELGGYNGNNVDHILQLLDGTVYNSTAADAGGALGPGGVGIVVGGSGGGSGLGLSERGKRHIYGLSDMLSLHLSPRLHEALLHSVASAAATDAAGGGGGGDGWESGGEYGEQTSSGSGAAAAAAAGRGGGGGGLAPGSSYLQTVMRLLHENIQLKSEIAKLYSGMRGSGALPADTSDEIDSEDLLVYRDLADSRRGRRQAAPPPYEGDETAGNRHVVHRHNHNRTRHGHHGPTTPNVGSGAGGGGGGGRAPNTYDVEHLNSYASGGGESREDTMYNGVVHNTDYNHGGHDMGDDHGGHGPKTVRTRPTTTGRGGDGQDYGGGHHGGGHGDNDGGHHRLAPSGGNMTHYFVDDGQHAHTQAEKLKEIAHILHFCSIGILGIFVAQLFLKLFGMGITEFFKKKMEIFDAVIILASFALDLVFLEGIGGAQGEEAAALLILFLLWRILRVINDPITRMVWGDFLLTPIDKGIMVTAKKRQEFRIKLQKRARRRGDKKVELLEEDKALKEKEIAALRELCARRGADEDEIKSCKPRRKSKSIMPRMDTSMGLTSVASLSLSLSMSMSGGAFNTIARSNPILNRRDSIQDILPQAPRTRRSSLMSSKPIEILQNHFRSGDKSPRFGSGSLFSKRLSMEKVVEEKEVENGGEELLQKRAVPIVIDDTEEEEEEEQHEQPVGGKERPGANTLGTGGGGDDDGGVDAGSGWPEEASVALLTPLAIPPPAPAPPQGPDIWQLPAVTFEMENELHDDHIVPLPVAFDVSSSPSPSHSELSQSTPTSLANGPVRRASTSSRHSAKEPDDDHLSVAAVAAAIAAPPVATVAVVTAQPGDALMHYGDVITHQTDVVVSPYHEPDVVVDDVQSEDAAILLGGAVQCDDDDVASHLNEVTTHLDHVSTHLDDVATHLNDVRIVHEDDDASSSSDSEESTQMLSPGPPNATGRMKEHETTRL